MGKRKGNKKNYKVAKRYTNTNKNYINKNNTDNYQNTIQNSTPKTFKNIAKSLTTSVKGIITDNYESQWSEILRTGDTCKYHNHDEVEKVEGCGTEYVVGFHIWNDDTEQWLVAKSLSQGEEVKEIIVTGDYYMKILSFGQFVDLLNRSKTHAIFSDETAKPVVLSVDEIAISLMREDGDKQITKEAINMNLFREYEALKSHNNDDFEKGRFLVLKGVVSMIKFDPVRGDSKYKMTQDEEEYWKQIRNDIIEGGKLLYKADGMDGMNDPLVWLFIPKMLHSSIDRMFNGVGGWRS
jgi:hypothetical protein